MLCYKHSTIILLVIALCAVHVALAGEIRGIITSTLNITEDSWLTSDVTCRVDRAPCIQVAASNLTFFLNGFTMTGQADPPAGCFPGGVAANAEHGILIAGQRRVEVFGPGVIQRFRGQGVLVGAATRITLKDFTISTNCNSGVLVGGSDNDLEGLVAVGNGNRESPCGGVCISGGNFNRVRGSVFGGNGYAVTATTNFGIGLLGTARGNIIEKNTVTGNVNGIFLQPGVIETLVFNNIVSGNPPIQTPLSIESFLGFDIRNQAAEGANTFHGNSCSTYSGAGAPPCPSIISVIRR